MIPTLGAWAPTVTQHVPNGTFATDRYNNRTPNFDDKARRIYAEFPGNSLETVDAAEDTVLADVVILVPAELATTSTDEWTCSDGLRYRVRGRPAPYRHPGTGTAVTQINLRRIS